MNDDECMCIVTSLKREREGKRREKQTANAEANKFHFKCDWSRNDDDEANGETVANKMLLCLLCARRVCLWAQVSSLVFQAAAGKYAIAVLLFSLFIFHFSGCRPSGEFRTTNTCTTYTRCSHECFITFACAIQGALNPHDGMAYGLGGLCCARNLLHVNFIITSNGALPLPLLLFLFFAAFKCEYSFNNLIYDGCHRFWCRVWCVSHMCIQRSYPRSPISKLTKTNSHVCESGRITGNSLSGKKHEILVKGIFPIYRHFWPRSTR